VAKITDIAVVTFSEKDVVRHNLVQQIIRAYEEHDMSASRQLPLRPKADSAH
jgi:phosphate starvation-inducible protein PhoH